MFADHKSCLKPFMFYYEKSLTFLQKYIFLKLFKKNGCYGQNIAFRAKTPNNNFENEIVIKFCVNIRSSYSLDMLLFCAVHNILHLSYDFWF